MGNEVRTERMSHRSSTTRIDRIELYLGVEWHVTRSCRQSVVSSLTGGGENTDVEELRNQVKVLKVVVGPQVVETKIWIAPNF